MRYFSHGKGSQMTKQQTRDKSYWLTAKHSDQVQRHTLFRTQSPRVVLPHVYMGCNPVRRHTNTWTHPCSPFRETSKKSPVNTFHSLPSNAKGARDLSWSAGPKLATSAQVNKKCAKAPRVPDQTSAASQHHGLKCQMSTPNHGPESVD